MMIAAPVSRLSYSAMQEDIVNSVFTQTHEFSHVMNILQKV
jgi:hypothetical protein